MQQSKFKGEPDQFVNNKLYLTICKRMNWMNFQWTSFKKIIS